MNPILVDVMRGNATESTHCGAIAVVDADGAVLATLGDNERPIFPRSAVSQRADAAELERHPGGRAACARHLRTALAR